MVFSTNISIILVISLAPEKDEDHSDLQKYPCILIFFVVYKFDINYIHYTNVASGLKIKSYIRLERKLVELVNKVFIGV